MPPPQYLVKYLEDQEIVVIVKDNYWVTEYERARFENEFGAGYNPGEKKWPQGNGYGKRYSTRKEKEMGKSYKPNGTQSKTYYTTQGPRRNGKYLPAKGPGNGQDGNGKDEGRDDKKKLEIPNMTLRIKGKKRVIKKILMN